jgi:uncharacterized protein
MRQAGEPSVEAILESIKRVIARDNEALAGRASAHAEAVPPATPEGEPVPDADDVGDVLDLAETDLAERDVAQPEGAGKDAAAGEDPGAQQTAPLIAEHTSSAVRGSLASLAVTVEARPPAGDQPRPPRPGDAALEGLVREMLRPALTEWLDRHMPPIVERLVAAEIARIVEERG